MIIFLHFMLLIGCERTLDIKGIKNTIDIPDTPEPTPTIMPLIEVDFSTYQEGDLLEGDYPETWEILNNDNVGGDNGAEA